MRLFSLIATGFVAVTCCVLVASARAETPAAAFEKGNHEFADGNFKDAIASYESAVNSGEWSANLFYNLANAYYRDHDFGRAVLNYERALRLDSHHPEAEANLRLVRDESHALEFTSPPAMLVFQTLDPSVLAIAAAGLFWAGVILLLWRIRTSTIAAAILCLIACAACAFGVYWIERGIRGPMAAVVVQDNMEARVATADSAQSILALPPGSEVLVLQPRGDWNYVALPNNQRGWISANALARIWL